MKEILLISVIYLIGCVCANIYIRFYVKKMYSSWTKGDRANGLLISLCSWFTVIALPIIHAVEILDNDDEANW